MIALSIAGVLVALGILLQPASSTVRPGPSAAATKTNPPQSISDLAALKPEELAQVDLARMNLICAQGLPGTENLDVEKSLQTLDQWAEKVRRYADAQLPQYLRHPADFNHSVAVFRMLALLEVLQTQCGVRPDSSFRRKVDFHNSAELFLPGTLSPARTATHITRSVLMAAVARKCGWPVHLVLAKDHVFCRWDGTYKGLTERVNIEISGRGLNTFSDDYYRKWPKPLSDEEIHLGGYLKTLSPQEELAFFLVQRGYCFQANQRPKEAAAMYELASRLSPKNQQFAQLAGKPMRLTKEELDQLEREAQKNVAHRTNGPDFGPDNLPRRLDSLEDGFPGISPIGPVVPRPGVSLDMFHTGRESSNDRNSALPGPSYRPPAVPGAEIPGPNKQPE